jgi:hypothetical protein
VTTISARAREGGRFGIPPGLTGVGAGHVPH